MPSLSEQPTLLEVMTGVVEGRLRSVRTWLPALVNDYDEQKQIVQCTAQVPLPYRDRTDGNKIKYDLAPRVGNCAVGFMGAEGFRITLPIEPGKTTGIILWAEAPINRWLEDGSVVDPEGTRRFHIADAMFIPILRPKTQAFTDVPRSNAMTVGYDGGPQLVISKSEVQLGGNPSSPPSDFVALSTPTKNELKKLHDAINDGFTKLRTDLQSIGSHTHLLAPGEVKVVGSGTGSNTDPITVPPSTSLASLQGPQDAGDVGDVKASVTKAK